MPVLAWTAWPDGRCDFLNQRYLDFTGFSPTEAQDWGWTQAYHPEDIEQILVDWKVITNSGKAGVMESRIRNSSGLYRWFIVSAAPLRTESGDIVKWYGVNTDIDDRKRAEEAVVAKERSLRLIIDTMPVLAWSAWPDGRCDFHNQRFLDFTGLSQNEARDWGWTKSYHPEDIDQLLLEWQAITSLGIPGTLETRIRDTNGSYRWFTICVAPSLDESGVVVKWYGVNTDIDDRKRAEQAVSANERNLRLIIDTMPTLAWSAWPDGSVDFLNDRYLKFAGLTAEEAHGWGWVQILHPDDLSQVTVFWQAIMISGESGQLEARMRRFDGEYRWFIIRAEPLLDDSGVIVKWYGTNNEIEDRKRAEEELRRKEAFLRKAQRLSETGSFYWLIETDEISFSEEACRIFDFDPNASVTFEMMAGRIYPDDMPLLIAKSEAARKTGEAHDYRIRLLMPDGVIKYLHTTSTEMRDLSGRREYIGAIQDVTQEHLAQESLNQARSELARVSRITSLSTLTASMAHEINQPLSGIITNANTCLRMLDAVPPNVIGARETAVRTLRDGNRASDVITRLRTLFSKKEFVAEHVDLNEAAREVIALSQSELQMNKVMLLTEFADNLPIVTGDRIQLQQVILNLIRNSSDAMRGIEDRPRRLIVRTDCVADNVCVTVEDSGVGFDPAMADRLFESFYTTKTDGMGIGLSVSRAIIEAHHGRLWAAANDGAGVTFIFSIPCDDLHSSKALENHTVALR